MSQMKLTNFFNMQTSGGNSKRPKISTLCITHDEPAKPCTTHSPPAEQHISILESISDAKQHTYGLTPENAVCRSLNLDSNLENISYCMMFDGCSKGNPGPAGAGAVIYANNVEIWARAIYVGDRETNNIAEYTGLLLGLNEAVRRKIKVIVVKGDSELAIKQMLGKYKVKSENLIDIYEQAKDMEKHFDKIEYIHVYRHLNKRADALSNEGLAKVRFTK